MGFGRGILPQCKSRSLSCFDILVMACSTEIDVAQNREMASGSSMFGTSSSNGQTWSRVAAIVGQSPSSQAERLCSFFLFSLDFVANSVCHSRAKGSGRKGGRIGACVGVGLPQTTWEAETKRGRHSSPFCDRMSQIARPLPSVFAASSHCFTGGNLGENARPHFVPPFRPKMKSGAAREQPQPVATQQPTASR